MRISKKKFKALEERIANIEKEQLTNRNYLKENIESNEELLEIVKNFRDDLYVMKQLLR